MESQHRFTVGIGSNFAVFDSDVLKSISRLNQFGKAAIQAGVDLARGFGSTTTNVINSLGRVGSSLRDQEEAFKRATTAAGRFYDAQGRLRESNGRFVSMGNNMRNAFENPLASLSTLALRFYSLDKALALAKQGLSIVSDFQRMDAALKAVSTSTQDFTRSQLFVRAAADQYGLSIEALTKSFVGFKANTNDTILQGAEAERIFLSVAKASAALQLSADDTTGTLRAFGQMLSKGTVQSEELKGQVGERLYNAFGMAAKAMNVSTMELNKMLQSGEVLAVDLLPKLATELEKSFGASAAANVNTMAGGFQRATDQLKLFIAEFAKTAGIDSFFGKISNGIANVIKDFRRAQNGDIQSEIEDFYGLTAEGKKQRMGQLGGDINRSQASLNTLLQMAPTPENLKREADLEKQIALMKRLYGEMFMAIRQEAKKTGQVIDTSFDIDKAKDRRDALAKQIQNIVGNNGTVSPKLRSEYDSLTAQIERAEAATKKQKESFSSVNSTITTNERLLKRLTQQYKEYGDAVIKTTYGDTSRGSLVAGFKQQVEIDKWRAENKGVLNGTKVDKIDRSDRLRNALMQQIAPLSAAGGLANKLSEITTNGYGSMNFYAKQVEEINRQLDKADVTRLALPQGTLEKLSQYLGMLRKANEERQRQMGVAEGKSIVSEINGQSPTEKWFSMEGIMSNWGDSALEALAKNRDRVIANAKDMTAAIQGVLRQGAISGAEAMAQFVGGLIAGTSNISDLPKVILGTVADMLQSLAQALAASAAFMLFVPGLQGQAAAQLAGAAGLFGVAALARSLAQPKQKKAAAFAAGGYVTGATNAVVGEYPGASIAGRGEFIAPVQKGAGYIAESLMKMGVFGGGGNGRLITRIAGRDIELILLRNEVSNKYY